MELIMTKCEERVKLFNAATILSVNVEGDGTASIPVFDDEWGDLEYICVDRNGNPCSLGDAIITTDELRKPTTKIATDTNVGDYDLRTAAAVIRWFAREYCTGGTDRCFGESLFADEMDDGARFTAEESARRILADIENQEHR